MELTKLETTHQYISLLDKATILCIPVSINGVIQDIKRGNDASISDVEEKLLNGCQMTYTITRREISISVIPKSYSNEDENIKFYSKNMTP